MIKSIFSSFFLISYTLAGHSIFFEKQSITLEKFYYKCKWLIQRSKDLGINVSRALKSKRGMLFIFEEKGFQKIWMLNVRFAIDIIWFDANKRIVHFEENVPPVKKTTTV